MKVPFRAIESFVTAMAVSTGSTKTVKSVRAKDGGDQPSDRKAGRARDADSLIHDENVPAWTDRPARGGSI